MLLIFLLMFILVFAFEKFYPHPPAPASQTKQAQTTKEKAPAAPEAPVAEVAAASAPAPVVPAVAGTKQASAETETVIENSLYKITFTNRGGLVKSWILKRYKNDTQTGPLDLVNNDASQKYGYPLSLWTYDEALRNKLNSVLYVPSVTGTQTAPADVTFEYSEGGLAVRKTFHFDHSYVVGVETSVTQDGKNVSALPAWPAGFGDQDSPAFYAAGLIDSQYNDKVERTAYKKISGGATIPGPFHWAGPTDQYFAAVFIPDDPATSALVTLRNPLTVARDPDKPKGETTSVDVLGAAVGNLHGPTRERAFVGPKELQDLQKVEIPGVAGAETNLTGLVDFGWWGLIAKPLFVWLRWTYSHMVANWGWAIVLQTFIITVALLPLRFSQMKSMLKMQRIQPQIKSIQEKYKKYSLRDPRKAAMNEEISAIYKREGVNPIGGCLPLLIQFPFIIAYYKMLGTALDLRHAHWLWIHDLSAADPYYILPIFMVLSMVVTQRMTPQVGMDASQQRMMNLMMPIMMGFIFFRLAAGLNLYYAESNLISIAQQAVMNRSKLGKEMQEIMAKRARKKDKK